MKKKKRHKNRAGVWSEWKRKGISFYLLQILFFFHSFNTNSFGCSTLNNAITSALTAYSICFICYYYNYDCQWVCELLFFLCLFLFLSLGVCVCVPLVLRGCELWTHLRFSMNKTKCESCESFSIFSERITKQRIWVQLAIAIDNIGICVTQPLHLISFESNQLCNTFTAFLTLFSF